MYLVNIKFTYSGIVLTYPMYFQWWRKANYSEQCKGEKAADKGLTTSIGYKGTDEFKVLKASITDFNDKLVKLTDEQKCKSHLYSAVINSSCCTNTQKCYY